MSSVMSNRCGASLRKYMPERLIFQRSSIWISVGLVLMTACFELPGTVPPPKSEGASPADVHHAAAVDPEPPATGPASIGMPAPAADIRTSAQPQAAPPQVVDVPLTEFLCCGQTAGETSIWGISYPEGWQVALLPNNPSAFFGALFIDPASSIIVAYIPAATTVPGSMTDSADVDSFFNGLAAERRQEFSGFQEVQRQPLPGLHNGRLWVATWPGAKGPMWEAVIATVSPTNLEHVMPGMPRGNLTMMGVRASASEWAQGSAIYEKMVASTKVKRMDGSMAPSNDGIGEPAVKSGMVRFCPGHCDWIWVNADRSGWNCPKDGYATELYEVACHHIQRQ